MPFDREQGIRQAHVHQYARAAVVDARQYYCLEKCSRLFSRFPVEQIRSQKTAFHRELVFHSRTATRRGRRPQFLPWAGRRVGPTNSRA